MIQLKSMRDNTTLMVDETQIVALERYTPPPSSLILTPGVEPRTTVYLKHGYSFEVKDTIEEIQGMFNAWMEKFGIDPNIEDAGPM